MTRPPKARALLLDSALQVFREKGFAATSVEMLCQRAGVTKGAFFHHFESKNALAVAACAHWSAVTGLLFEQAPYHRPEDPLDRVLAYIAFRRLLLRGTPSQFTCVAGTLAQEVHASHGEIRQAAADSILAHADTLVEDFALAIERHPPVTPVDARSLAVHTQAVLQGAFVLAKATGSEAPAQDSVDHLYRYIAMLFGRDPTPPLPEPQHD
ncbi:MAG: TetR/AcrR family transcriptional regulator [Burkholderiaceae bacterium]